MSIIFTLFVNTLALIFTGPGNRFFIPIFLIGVSTTYLVTIKNISFRRQSLKKYSKNFSILISILSIVLIPRLSDYLNFNNGTKIINIEVEKVNYAKLDGYWGTNPTNTSLCWERIDCLYGNPKILFNEESLSFERTK